MGITQRGAGRQREKTRLEMGVACLSCCLRPFTYLLRTLIPNMNKKDQTKKPRGRPPEAEKIPHIPDTPENVAKSIMLSMPKKDWDYLKKDKRKKD